MTSSGAQGDELDQVLSRMKLEERNSRIASINKTLKKLRDEKEKGW